MNYIYKILSCIRFLFRNKKIKKYLTIAMISILLSMLCSRVFAFNVVDENQNSLTFGDINESELDTLNNINDYNIFIFDLHTTSVYNSQYRVFFISKEYTDNYSYFIYDDRTTTTTYKLSAPSANCRLYSAYYSFDNGIYNYATGSLDYYSKNPSNNLTTLVVNSTLVYSSMDVISYGEYLSGGYTVYSSTDEPNQESVTLYTNWFSIDYSSNYAVHMVMYPNTENSLNVTLPTEINELGTAYRYYFEAEENGDYEFVFRYMSDNDYFSVKTINKTVSNIVSSFSGRRRNWRRKWRRWRKWK